MSEKREGVSVKRDMSRWQKESEREVAHTCRRPDAEQRLWKIRAHLLMGVGPSWLGGVAVVASWCAR